MKDEDERKEGKRTMKVIRRGEGEEDEGTRENVEREGV